MKTEQSDMEPRAVVWTLAGLIGLVALACMIVAAFLSGTLHDAEPKPLAAASAPALQVSERGDRAAIEARSMRRLQGQDGGLSIEDAMRRTAAAGWDAPS